MFSNGQIRNGSVTYTLRQVDDDHVEMSMQSGGTLKLQRCEYASLVVPAKAGTQYT